jgi:hypothetical protein
VKERQNIIAIDLSSHTGWAMFVGGECRAAGTFEVEKKVSDFGPYPGNYIKFADQYVAELVDHLMKVGGGLGLHLQSVDAVVLEETTASKSNYSQKLLEYLHYALLKRLLLWDRPIAYVRTGVWRAVVGAHQTKEERNLNAKIARLKKKTGAKLAKIDGKVVGKKDRKDYAIRVARDIFGKDFKKKDNNEVDARLLGYAFIKGAPICDGTADGGTLPKEKQANQTSEVQ